MCVCVRAPRISFVEYVSACSVSTVLRKLQLSLQERQVFWVRWSFLLLYCKLLNNTESGLGPSHGGGKGIYACYLLLQFIFSVVETNLKHS